MAINFRGYLYDDSGNAIQGATVQLLEQDGDEEASTTTDSNGLWYFSESDEDSYDVKITRGSSIRYIQWDDQISLKEIDVRNSTGNTTPAATFTNITNHADNDVAYFRSLRGTGADNDEMFIRYYMDDASSNTTEVARMTVKLISASAASEDSEIRWGVAVGGSIVDVLTISNTDAGATDLTFDVAGDVNLDADGGDIFFKDGGTTFGSATNTSGNLIIKSGTTTALTFSGANATIAGDLTISGDDLTMATNTSGAALIGDGTNYNPVVISGDISIGTTGTAAIGSGVVVNADVNSSAAIEFSKMENLTTARALVSDGSGDVSVSAVTSTELGYLDGVASNVQTQIDNIVAGTVSTVNDSDFRIRDNSDSSKQIAFQASGVSSSTTRTITMPDSDVTLGEGGSVTTGGETFTNYNTISSTVESALSSSTNYALIGDITVSGSAVWTISCSSGTGVVKIL